MSPSTRTKAWDAADYIESADDVLEFLKAALEEGDPAHFMNALGVVARSNGMSAIAAKSGLNRENLYRVLSGDGNPELTTLIKVLDAMGLELDLRRKERADASID